MKNFMLRVEQMPWQESLCLETFQTPLDDLQSSFPTLNILWLF